MQKEQIQQLEITYKRNHICFTGRNGHVDIDLNINSNSISYISSDEFKKMFIDDLSKITLYSLSNKYLNKLFERIVCIIGKQNFQISKLVDNPKNTSSCITVIGLDVCKIA